VFVRYQTYEHDMMTKNEPVDTNEPSSMQIGTSGPRGESMKRSRGQEVKGQNVKGEDHMRPKLHFEACSRHRYQLSWVE